MGKKKTSVEIREKVMDPYYIVVDENQYILMKEGNHIAKGYYTKLSHAVGTIIKGLILESSAGNKLTLRKYIENYESLKTELIETLEL